MIGLLTPLTPGDQVRVTNLEPLAGKVLTVARLLPPDRVVCVWLEDGTDKQYVARRTQLELVT